MKNLKISYKIGALLAILIVINVGLATVLLVGMGRVNDQSTIIASNWLPSVRLLGDINTLKSNIRIVHIRIANAQSEAEHNEMEALLNTRLKKMAEYLAQYEKLISSDAERQIYTEFHKVWTQYVEQQKKMVDFLNHDNREQALALLSGTMRSVYDQSAKELEDLIEFNKKGSDAASALGDTIYGEQKMLGIAGLLATIAFAGAIVVILNRNVATPVVALKTYMGVLQAGDYTQEVPLTDRVDEVGQMAGSIQSFRESLIANREMEARQRAEDQLKLERQARVDELVRQFDALVSGMVSSVAAAATELAQTATALSSQVDDAARQTTGVAGAADQTSGTVQSVASAAEEMSASIREISQQVSHSSTMVREATKETQSADGISKDMLNAARSINSIAEIIDGIAGQINLLALNATIESARAGEAGKGFAVVANEVKTLAGQTGRATEEIRQKLEGLQTMAAQVASALGKVSDSVEKVNEVSGNISAAVEQQTAVTHEIVSNMNTAAAGVDEINSNIQGIRHTNDNTAAATQQILSASEILSRQAEDLNAEVRRFLEDIRAA